MRHIIRWFRLSLLLSILAFLAGCLEVEVDRKVLEDKIIVPQVVEGAWENEHIKIDVEVTDRRAVAARMESEGKKSVYVGFILEIEDGAYAFLYEESNPMIHDTGGVKLLCYIGLNDDAFELFFPDEEKVSRFENVKNRFPFPILVNNQVETIVRIWKKGFLNDQSFLFRRVKGSE